MPFAVPQVDCLQGPIRLDLCDITCVKPAILNRSVLQKQELAGHAFANKDQVHRLTKPRADTRI